MIAIILGFLIGGILPTWGLRRYIEYRRWQAAWEVCRWQITWKGY